MNTERGTLIDFDGGSYLATVQLDGALANYLTVATSRGIHSAQMQADRRVAVLFLDPGNPGDAVVVAVWTE